MKATALTFTLYQSDGKRFIPKAPYLDMVDDGTGIYVDVHQQQRFFPNQPYYLCRRGTDPLESFFGCLRSCTTDWSFDVVQIADRCNSVQV